jgi:hypothetical protein
VGTRVVPSLSNIVTFLSAIIFIDENEISRCARDDMEAGSRIQTDDRTG